MTTDEDDDERITRNWTELLQELRVAQTGAQILTGFLLTVPFSARFGALDRVDRAGYLAVTSGAVLTTALLVAPVMYHRLLFHQRMRPWLVVAADRCAKAGLVVLAATSCGCVFLVFDVAAARLAAVVAVTVAASGYVALWWLIAEHRPFGQPTREEMRS